MTAVGQPATADTDRGGPPPSLQISRLAFAYPDGHQALYGVDLTIRRGERVHLAMLSRGWTGEMPRLSDAVTTQREWAWGLAPVGVALALALTGWVTT